MVKRELVISILLVSTVILGMFGTSRADFTDDFEDGAIGSEWIISEWGGLNGTEVGGKLIVNGTYDPGETAPNTLGWNQYWMFYNESFTGFLDISVTNTITSYTGEQLGVGLGVIENTSVIWDNQTAWVQFNWTSGVNAVGEMHSWHNMSVVRTVFDDRDTTVGDTYTHRMVVHENKSVQFILDGATKGWWNMSHPQYYPFLVVGIKVPGTSIEVELDDFVLVTDANPIAVLTPTSANLDVGELVGFDGSQSTYVVGSMEAYSFDFGDGNSSGWIDDAFTTHSYAAEGSYDARLKVRADNGKESDWASVTICVDCAIPVAELTGSPTRVKTFEHVNFSSEGSSDTDGIVVGYFFDFDDGSTSGWIMSPYVDHHFVERGAYHARVKVIDDDGHESLWSTSLVEIVVESQPPVAVLTASALEVYVGEMVCFNGSMSHDIDGVIVFYEFYLGDGYLTGGRHDAVYCYEYDEAGTYNVTLVVEDGHSMESENEAQVTIVVKEREGSLDVLGWWIAVIALLLIILAIVTYVALQQRRLVRAQDEPEEPPPTEDESK